MKTYVIANRKGGCGKSTTALALANWLIMNGKKVILLDLDSQCNLSYASGFDTAASPDMVTLYDVLSGTAKAQDAIRPMDSTLFGGGSIIPASENLAAFDSGLETASVKLQDVVKAVSPDYDYCIIDTPLSLGKMTIAALMAANELVVPCMADIYNLQGVQALARVLDAVRPYNKRLKVAGILPTRNNDRLVLTKSLTDMITAVAQQMGTKVFDARIREGVAVREAAAQQMGIFTYDPKCRTSVVADYQKFIIELLKGDK